MGAKKQETKEVFEQGLSAGIGIGVTLGLITGVATAYFYKKNKTLSADDILEKVKQEFLQDGPIEGSWIHFKKEPKQKFAIKNTVYTGGISRIEDGVLAQYEFIADAFTGSVLDIYKID